MSPDFAVELPSPALGHAHSSRPQDALLSDMELALHGTFYPLGFPVEVRTNDARVLQTAQESFGHVETRRGDCPRLVIRIAISASKTSICPAEPTRREFNHLYSLVADADNQALLDFKTLNNCAWLTTAALSTALYFRTNFLEKIVYLLLGASVVTDIHAACVSRAGKGILLCGSSGAGKSTLAYACARQGWTYTSDDTSYLLNASLTPHVIGHAHRVRFRPEARMLFPELESHPITPRMEGKPSIEVPLAALPIRSAQSEAAVHAVVYLRRFPSAVPCLRLMPPGTATRRMRKELYSAGDIRIRHEEILCRFDDVPTYELQYCELQDGIDELERLAADL